MILNETTQDEMIEMNLHENDTCIIEYKNKDYFNGEETLERTKAKVIFQKDKFVFLVSDPYGMDKFINCVKIISKC